MTVLTISTILYITQTATSILTRPNHISTHARPQHSHKYTIQTQHHKGWKTCTTLMTAWLSITNQVWTHIPKVWGLGNNINACMPIGIKWSRVTCFALPLDAQTPAHRTLEDSQSCRCLTIATRNNQCKQINKQYLMTKQTVSKGATHCYEHVGIRIT
jgi:hypothetical protein